MFANNRFPSALDDSDFARSVASLRESVSDLVDLADGSPARAWSVISDAQSITDSYVETIAKASSAAVHEGYNPAPLGRLEARNAVATYYSEHGAEVDPSRIVLCASTSEAYTWLAKLLASAGDTVRIPKPSYPLFEHLLGLEGLTTIPDHLAFHGQWTRSGLPSQTNQPAFAVAVNPNNPTGHTTDAALLQHLHDAYNAVAVDEVFLDYPVDTDAIPSSLITLAECDDPGLHFVISGISKICGLPGLKLGWIVLDGPEELVGAAMSRLSYIADTFLSANDVAQRALPDLLKHRSAFQTALKSQLREARRVVRLHIDDARGWSSYPVEGGWYQILRFPDVVEDKALATRLLAEDGIEVAPGFLFDLDPGHLVVSLVSPPALLDEYLPRIIERFRSIAEA
jgi:aspartate/methionine/tyrosine aminotransferase